MKIKEEDVRIDTYQPVDEDGQPIGDPDSGIRLTHFPSGIVVQRSGATQEINKDEGMKALTKLTDDKEWLNE